VKANISSERSSSHRRQAPLHSKLKLSPRLLLISYSLAARPFSLAGLPTTNQITFPLQQLATLALDTFLRRQSSFPVALLLLTFRSQPKRHGVIYHCGATASTSSVASCRAAVGKGVQLKVGPPEIK